MPDPTNPTDQTQIPPVPMDSQTPPPPSDDMPMPQTESPGAGPTETPPSGTDSGTAAPPYDIVPPAITPTPPRKKFGGKRFIATILGLLVLVGGLGAGVILVRQQQDIREKAATDANACERAGGSCYNTPSCARIGRSIVNGGNGCIASRGEICCGRQTGPTPTPSPSRAPSPSPTSTTTSCTARGGTCQSAQSCTGSTIPGPFSDCHPSPSMPNVVCCVRASPSPSQRPQVPCRKCNPSNRLCYMAEAKDDCDPALDECPQVGVSCTPGGSPSPRASATPNICALSRRDPNSKGYCDRSAPNTQNCTDKAEGSSCTIVPQCGGGTGTCVVINQGGANSECQCQKGGVVSSPRPSLPPPPDGPTAQCLDIKAFDTNWSPMTIEQLSALKPGDKVRFTVAGQTNSGSIDKARFKVNGTVRPEVTQKRPSSEEYYDEITIPEGVSSFSINAELHHSSLGWF